MAQLLASLLLLVALWPVAALADAPAPPDSALQSCVPGSGVWSELPDGGGFQLDAALCVVRWPHRASDPQDATPCPELVSMRFDADGGAIGAARVATTPRTLDTCALRFVAPLGRAALYDDGKQLLRIDTETLKPAGTLDLPREHVAYTPRGDLILYDAARLVIVAPGEEAAAAPQILFETTLRKLAELVWQPTRLILVEDDAMRWWTLDLVSGLPSGEPQRNAFGRPLGDAIWDVDAQGLVRSMSDRTRVGWFRFAPDDAFYFTVNSGAVVRAIDGHPNLTVLVSESNDAKAYARVGPYFKRRYEARYWSLEDGKAPGNGGRRTWRMALRGEGDRLVMLDGELGKRAAVLDVSALTWRRVSILELGTPARLVSLQGSRLVTVHPGQQDTLVAWDINTGARLAVLDRAALQVAGLGTQIELEPPGPAGHDGIWTVRDERGHLAFFDETRHVLLGQPAEATPPLRSLRRDYVRLPSGALLLDEDVPSQARHVVVRRDGAPVVLSPPTTVADAMTPTERWFGYCAPGMACGVTLAPVERAQGSLEQWTSVPVTEAAQRPVDRALIFLAASIVLLILVVVWRTDVGRRGRLDVLQRQMLSEVLESTELSKVLPSSSDFRVLESETMHLGPTTALVDRRGRRYVTDQDAEGFVHRTWTHLPWRLGLSLMVGAAVAIPMGFVYLVKEPLAVSLPYWLALWLPVSATTFILSSWALWNRRHLLRYGFAVEGQWYDSGTSRASLCYTMPGGATYRMRRGQWKRADLVPVVLADPSRPRFAAQYTGNGQFPVAQLAGQRARLRGTSVTRDAMRLLLVLLLSGGTVAGAIHTFGEAFPEPVSSWTMASIEAEAEKADEPMLGPCLELCETLSDGATCFRQCQSRQMRRVFESAGIELAGDPELMPGEMRLRQLERIEEVTSLMAAGTDDTCDALAASIDAVPRWDARLETAFVTVYGGPLGASDEQLPPTEARIAALGAEAFAPLCSPPAECLAGSGVCPQPPACQGPVDRLRTAICSFGLAMTPIAP